MKNLIYLISWRWIGIVMLITVLDFLTKKWVSNQLMVGQIKFFIPYFNWFYVRNYGAVFGFLSDQDGWQRWFFACIAIVSVVVLLLIMYQSNSERKMNNISYAFIIGGALGNLYDRLWNGFVIDFIDFYIGNWHYPTFNLADSFICVGAAMMLSQVFLSTEKR